MSDQKTVAVADHYNAVVEDYHLNYDDEAHKTLPHYPANYFRLQILKKEVAKLGAKSIYEAGLGEGTPLAHMAEMGLRVAGSDIAQNMVAAAKANFTRRGLDPDVIQMGNIDEPESFANQLEDGLFDAMMASGVLPHVADDETALRNMRSIIRPGGTAFIEFRNSLFSMFTLNRFTKEFFLDELLKDVPDALRDATAKELDARLATDMPPLRTKNIDGDGPGYDLIQANYHNPFELLEQFEKLGFADMKIHWYHFHPAPPMLEKAIGPAFREAAMAMEYDQSWRGMFLCSAGVVQAVRS
ncbi:MAG: class I SAM-dependent methyltransferase [Robiginitomaculum sp.]|nr:class I SAM-dependent methyltransferase [Robiginitomaculum sp.]MDQ7077375.1 class I SAM-dependent methyltransferase [Robiginitomaculum sp.]